MFLAGKAYPSNFGSFWFGFNRLASATTQTKHSETSDSEPDTSHFAEDPRRTRIFYRNC
jgi:hypothetical protein